MPPNNTPTVPLREVRDKNKSGSSKPPTTTENAPAPPSMQAYMGPSLFQPHFARRAIGDAHDKKIPPLVGYYAGLSSVPIARFLAPMGYDMVWIDWEHTSCGVETMTTVGCGCLLLRCRRVRG